MVQEPATTGSPGAGEKLGVTGRRLINICVNRVRWALEIQEIIKGKGFRSRRGSLPLAGRAGRQAGRKQTASLIDAAPRKLWPDQQPMANELEWTVTISVT